MEKFVASVQSKKDPQDVKTFLVSKDRVGEFLSQNLASDVVVVFMEAPKEFTLK